jgi:hypothetical protein
MYLLLSLEVTVLLSSELVSSSFPPLRMKKMDGFRMGEITKRTD